MNRYISFALVLLLSGYAFGQKQRPPARSSAPVKKTVSKPKPTPTPAPADPAAEKAKLDEILALPSAAEKAAGLTKFLSDFPASDQKPRAVEALVIARAIVADEKLQVNENSEGVAMFRLAVADAPTPIPDRLFNEIVSKFPANLFYRGQRAPALEIAEAIEKKSAGNAGQLLTLAAFYIGIESGDDARRLAEAAIAIDPVSVTAYQTLGLADRLNFDLERSAAAYAKALELDAGSVASKRSLAEMKRALGKADEAAALYREIVTAIENDSAAKTGLILSLFGAGKKAEAEAEMVKALEQNPKHLNLVAGAAYWYAANDLPDKAVEFGQKAIDLEPRYIWGHIALARGLMSQKKPVDAERVLIMARRYGNFPTLEYEIASARMMAGFYREAVEELQKSFVLKDGLIETRLGGRVSRGEKSFADLIAYERRASIFEPAAADNSVTAAKMRLLFELTNKLASEAPDEAELTAITDEFVKGDDKMKLHRQLYSAGLLLQKNAALPKAIELTRSAVGNTDAGLEVSAPAAAVMASELYESRTIAFARNEIIVVPDVPRQTLSAILRGRVEELSGWALYQQKSYPEAAVRLRRAISVLPDKSAWWRSSMWRLGAALQGEGKDKEALDSYIASYKTDKPNPFKYGEIEVLYSKVNGGTEGLEDKIGPNPMPKMATVEPAKAVEAAVQPVETPAKTGVVPVPEPIKSTADEKSEITPTSEIPPKAAEEIQPKTEPAPAKLEEKVPITDAALKTPESTEPKLDNVPAAVDPKETTTDVSESAKQTVETAKPASEVPPVDKNEIKPPEVPVKAVEESEVKPDVPKAITGEPKENSTSAESPKIETSQPALEQPKKADSEPKPDLQVVKTEEKEAEKAEIPALQNPPPPATPVETEPLKTEPRNFLRDPPLEPEPETTEPQPSKPSESLTAANPAAVKKPVVIVEDTVHEQQKPQTAKGRFEPVANNASGNSPDKPVRRGNGELFEPIIITVPAGAAKNVPKKDPAKTQNAADADVSSGASRVRIVDGKEITAAAQCSLELSEESVSIIGGGGSLGVLVSFKGDGDLKSVVAASNSPRDIEVKPEPEIEGASGRRFYVIRSISSATGVFQVLFESGCGKKEVVVKVR